MKLFPKSTLGNAGFWITLVSSALLGLKIAGVMPIPTPAIFSLIFVGSLISIVAFIRKDRSWLQLVVVAPMFMIVLIWSLAEVIWPH